MDRKGSEGMEQEKLNLRETVGFGIGAVGKDMVYMLTASYVMYYYQDLLGLSSAFVGLILMIARVFDAVNDPIMGMLVAKTKTRWGRFRPWIFSGTLINAFITYGLFAVPGWCTGKSLMVWFAIVYIFWGMSYTLMDIPYWSMIPALTNTSRDREHMSTVGRSCAGVGSALITVFTMIIVPRIGKALASGEGKGVQERIGFQWFGLIIAVIFIVAELICCMNVKEKKLITTDSPSIKEMFSALLHNDQAITVVITIALVNTALYITSNLLIYFFKYDYGTKSWNDAYAIFNTFGGAIQILAMMLFLPILRQKLSVLSCFRFGMVMSISGYAVLLLMCFLGLAGNVYFLLIPGFMVFAGNGILTVLTTLLLANTCDYGELKNGHREESVIFSMQTFVVKLASGIAAFITGIGIDLIGLKGNNSTEGTIMEQSAQTLAGLRMIMTLFPILALCIAFFFFFKHYILTEEKLLEIQETLKKKHI